MTDGINHTEDSSSVAIFDNLIWMTSEEAAQYLRMSVGALRTAVSRGDLRFRKWRRRLYFKKAELDLLLEGSFKKGGF
ncbi:MAG: helix-turn-helix domain-containing protein [Bdellovibrio sp.]|nr:helix-turn-helix domain-containing protein [Bdellovibrio sp.]